MTDVDGRKLKKGRGARIDLSRLSSSANSDADRHELAAAEKLGARRKLRYMNDRLLRELAGTPCLEPQDIVRPCSPIRRALSTAGIAILELHLEMYCRVARTLVAVKLAELGACGPGGACPPPSKKFAAMREFDE